MEEKLRFIFENVNGWLKYIETKNAALLTLSSAIVVCLLQSLKSIDNISQSVYYSIIYFLMVFSISALSVLWSFIAQLNKKLQNAHTNCYISHNLIFYGDVYRFDAEQYLNLLYEKYNDNKVPQPLPPYEIDLANQIIINSCLAMKKGTLFNNTVYFIIVAISCFIFFILIFNIFFNKGGIL